MDSELKNSGCYDYQLKFHDHPPLAIGQRYASRTTGRCRLLKVQTTKDSFMPRIEPVLPTTQSGGTALYKTVPVSDHVDWTTSICSVLVAKPAKNPADFAIWIGKWCLLFLAMIWTLLKAFGKVFSGYRVAQSRYPRYVSYFHGQFWSAKSSREYSVHKQRLVQRPSMQLPLSPPTGIVRYEWKESDIYTAKWPRQLMVRPQYVLEYLRPNRAFRCKIEQMVQKGGNEWIQIKEGSEFDQFLRTAKYLAVSYRRMAYNRSGGPDLDSQSRARLLDNVGQACDELRLNAYWLDEQCMEANWDEKNYDLYRIADVFRYAAATVIMLPDDNSGKPTKSVSDSILGDRREWELWGDRVWTFPEALVSKKLYYKVGDGAVNSVGLRQLTNIAFPREAEEASAIIEHYSGNVTLSRLNFLSLLKDAIWRRSHTPDIVLAQPAEGVYALMGFFEHRIMPDYLETELQALARLSMANDDDRFAERMIAMLPKHILDTACWYADDDEYNAKLWDIEPDVQVAGITESGSLVLNGCRTAIIRWKDFPKVVHRTKGGFRRGFVRFLSWTGPYLFILGAAFAQNGAGGVIVLIIGLFLWIFAPWMNAYANSGRVTEVEPWLIGVEGVMSAEEAEWRVYGTIPFGQFPPKIQESPTGSLLARPLTEGKIRKGDRAYQMAKDFEQHAELDRTGEKVFTLVDTISNSIYYFSARRPPTVCVLVGREGGLGRYLLCSEHCDRNELHKETVIRMPTYVSQEMRLSHWIAIGRTSA